MKKCLLVDGNSMIFRAYYATLYGSGNMTSRAGVPTNAIYGFVLMMNKALELIEPDYVMVAFDAGKKTFRHEVYADYKGGRKATPEDLIAQFSLVRKLLDSWNIRWYEKEGIEADDIVGSMVKRTEDIDTSVLTSDHDLLQLIDKTTAVWLMKKGMTDIEKMDEQALMETMGITPIQITDMKGLMGDSSDNIPGVPKVGQKTALKLIQEYGTVENLLDHVDEQKGKLKENLIEYHDQALMCKKLATIFTEVDVPYSLEDCIYKPDYRGLMKFFVDYDFNSFIKKIQPLIDAENNKVEEVSEYSCQQVTSVPAKLLIDNTVVYFDVDCDELDANLYGAVFKNKLDCVYICYEDLLKDSDTLDYLKGNLKKKMYDAKKSMHLARRNQIELNHVDEDVLVLTFLCDSNCTSFSAMKEKFDLVEPTTLEDVYGKGVKMKFPDSSEQIAFASKRADVIEKMYDFSYEEVKNMNLIDYYYNIEMPLVNVLYKMEVQGVRVDVNVLDSIATKTLQRINELSASIYQIAGGEFNLNSPKQLAEVLFDRLGLPTGKKRSTSVDVLEKLKDKSPIIPQIMEYRKVQKLYSTYAEGLKKYIQNDGKIHTIYNQCLTQTGRLSSSDPNLQNITVRDEQSREIRKAFLPEADCMMLGADYSQIELRVLAHMANEEGLINAFNSGLDIHTKTAMDVFNVSKEEVTSLMRRQAKAVNFGIVYGISDFGLSEQLDISRYEAKQFIENYLNSYPNISVYMDEQVRFCEEHGYVETILGRRREIREIHDKNYMMREFGKRAAMNAPIQGSASDLIKIAMIKIDQQLTELGLRSKMILQVHDELIFNVPNDEVEIMKKLIVENMQQAMSLKVPLSAEWAIGNNWYEAK